MAFHGNGNCVIATVVLGLASAFAQAATPDLLVSNSNTNTVLRFDGSTGAYVGAFIPAGSGGLGNPHGLTFGPDGNLYVCSQSNNSILKYDGATGASLGAFVSSGSGGLSQPHDLVFGPDGRLYVSSYGTSSVIRYNGTTGALIGTFASGSGLSGSLGLTFGPDGNLYVCGFNSNQVNRYNGSTGASMGVFASGAGMNQPTGIVFGPDGNMYVSNWGVAQVNRFNGTTGASMGIFATVTGMGACQGIRFGTDGNLYVVSYSSNSVKRFNGGSGAFIDTYTSGGSPNAPTFMAFLTSEVTLSGMYVDFQSNKIARLYGTGPNGTAVTVYRQDDTAIAGATSWDGNGNFYFTPTTPLDSGTGLYASIASGSTTRTKMIAFDLFDDVFADTSAYHGAAPGTSMRVDLDATYTFKTVVNGGSSVTITAWLQKNGSYTGTAPSITLTGLGITGTGGATASLTAAANTWQQVSVTGTPNAAGVLTLTFETFSTAAGSAAWIDDIVVSQ